MPELPALPELPELPEFTSRVSAALGWTKYSGFSESRKENINSIIVRIETLTKKQQGYGHNNSEDTDTIRVRIYSITSSKTRIKTLSKEYVQVF